MRFKARFNPNARRQRVLGRPRLWPTRCRGCYDILWLEPMTKHRDEWLPRRYRFEDCWYCVLCEPQKPE